MTTRFEEAVRILNDECMPDLADYVRDLYASHEALLKAFNQFVLEIDHCRSQGPWWFTKGESGLHMHVRAQLDKAREAMRNAEALLEKQP